MDDNKAAENPANRKNRTRAAQGTLQKLKSMV
jgi:hypothetical protein